MTFVIASFLYLMVSFDWSRNVDAFECNTITAGRFGQIHNCLSKDILLFFFYQA